MRAARGPGRSPTIKPRATRLARGAVGAGFAVGRADADYPDGATVAPGSAVSACAAAGAGPAVSAVAGLHLQRDPVGELRHNVHLPECM